MALITLLPCDHADGIAEPEAGDIRDVLNTTAIVISRSMARLGKADEAMRRCDAASLVNRYTLGRARQLLARTYPT